MSKRDDEYECQFWGFSAKEISTGLRTAIFDSFETYAMKMFDAIRKRVAEEKMTVLSNNFQTLLNELATNWREKIDNLEKYISETFSLPHHLLLTGDSLQRQQYTDQDKEDLEKEIEQLWKDAHRIHFLEFHLSKELEKHKKIETIVQRLKQLELPPVDSLPNPKHVHHPVLDVFGLEVEEAGCHLKAEEEEENYDVDSRDIQNMMFFNL